MTRERHLGPSTAKQAQLAHRRMAVRCPPSMAQCNLRHTSTPHVKASPIRRRLVVPAPMQAVGVQTLSPDRLFADAACTQPFQILPPDLDPPSSSCQPTSDHAAPASSDGHLPLPIMPRQAGVPFKHRQLPLLTHSRWRSHRLGVAHFVQYAGDAHLEFKLRGQAREHCRREPRALPKAVVEPGGDRILFGYPSSTRSRISTDYHPHTGHQAPRGGV